MAPDFFGSARDIEGLERQLSVAARPARAAMLAVLAWYLRQRDMPRAQAMADEAERLLDAAPEDGAESRRTRARLLLVRGEASMLTGRSAHAAAIFASARSAFEAVGDDLGAGDAALGLADLCDVEIQSTDAAFGSAVAIFEATGDRVRQGVARAKWGVFGIDESRARADACWAMLDDAATLNCPGLQALVLFLDADRRYFSCDFQGAIAPRREGIELALASGQVHMAVMQMAALGGRLKQVGENAGALEALDRALGLARPTGWPRPTARVLLGMADSFRRLGELDAAWQLIEEARGLFEPGLQSQSFWPMLCQLAGDVLLERGEAAQALAWYEKMTGFPKYHSMSMVCRAKACSRLRRLDEARQLLDDAADWYSQRGFLERLSVTQHSQAEVARLQSRPAPAGSSAPNASIHHLEAALATAARIPGHTPPHSWVSQLARDYEAVGDLATALRLEREAALGREKMHTRRAADLTASLQVRHQTERARAETAHHKALAEAQAARADAEARANRAKTTFLANMSHELRSPLNAMLGFTRLLLRDTEMARQREELGIVLRSGEHLYTLINQVLEMSKIEAGRVSVTPVDFDLLALLDELREMFSVSVRAKKLRLQVHAAAGVPQHVRADAMKLRQVLINLLSNAVKFTEAGGVELEVSALTGGEGLVLSFCVADTGVGIEADDLAQLGGAFQQAQAGRQAAEGTGLGLAISGGFVQLMGGELRLSSTPGVGTRASFDIPVQPVEGPAVEVRARHRRVVGLAAGTPATRILVVDDRADGRMLLARTLQPLGFQVREAADGLQAVNACAQWSPHLVLMDMRMPVMDGREATRRIRAADPGVVVIALTASSFEEQREDILAAGCHDFMRKPLDEDALLDAIARHLHLQLRYGDESLPPLGTQPDAGRLAAVPAPLREQLRTALARLDVAAVEEAMHELQRHDTALAAAVQPLIRRFDYGRVNAMLGGPR